MDIPVGSGADLRDEVVDRPVVRRETTYRGLVWDVTRDRVDLGDAGEVTREYVDHPGAVIVVALREVDGVDHVAMIRQYRHPVRTLEWELPAGLLDEAGEPPWEAAARELGEEVDLAAGTWHVLADFYSSPGGVSESLRVFLARDVHDAAPQEGFVREGEEAGITAMWVPLDEAYDAVLAGQVHNPGAVVGVLTAWGARARGWASLRPYDAPWPWHPAYR
ncbi:NUDIX domain-containing protein [Lapillicoccus jejuensis]|uniref:ADP-ribose pyrophosphatase n=1 Tax=Lapillicoccus jejuensis TaxID=402171 RepID=A0A542E6T3_9MICO|nr:NUDIX hydrolase [Lapillicoccus jejuensis]TQJ10966.1 ADP-ribose pyrophosphatase [Lapillicoccus jejuensis]